MKGDKVCININGERVVRFANKDEEYLCGLVPHLRERESALLHVSNMQMTLLFLKNNVQNHIKNEVHPCFAMKTCLI